MFGLVNISIQQFDGVDDKWNIIHGDGTRQYYYSNKKRMVMIELYVH